MIDHDKRVRSVTAWSIASRLDHSLRRQLSNIQMTNSAAEALGTAEILANILSFVENDVGTNGGDRYVLSRDWKRYRSVNSLWKRETDRLIGICLSRSYWPWKSAYEWPVGSIRDALKPGYLTRPVLLLLSTPRRLSREMQKPQNEQSSTSGCVFHSSSHSCLTQMLILLRLEILPINAASCLKTFPLLGRSASTSRRR